MRKDAKSPDEPVAQKLMPVSVALDANGKPTTAMRKRLEGLGRPNLADLWPNAVDGPDRLTREPDGKAEAIFLYSIAKGSPLQNGLQAALDETIEKLPIPRVMSYQRADGTTVRFVRPAHRLLALHGAGTIAVHALGLEGDLPFSESHGLESAREQARREPDEFRSRPPGVT